MHLMNWSEFWRESRDGKFLPSPEKREIEALSSIRPVVESPGCRWVLPGGTGGVWRLVACLSLICCVPTTQHRWRCLLIPGPWSAPTPTMSFSCRPMVPSGPAHEPLSVGKWLIFLRGRILQEVCQAFFLNCAKKTPNIRSKQFSGINDIKYIHIVAQPLPPCFPSSYLETLYSLNNNSPFPSPNHW